MTIEVQCPGCGAKYRVSDSAAGKSLRCKNAECGQSIEIPEFIAVEDDFADSLDEAAADLGQPLSPVVRSSSPGDQPLRAQYDDPRFDEPVPTSAAAVTSLVLGIFSVGCSILTGIPAVILGIIAIATPGGGEDVELPVDARDVGVGVSDAPVGPRKTAAQRAADRRQEARRRRGVNPCLPLPTAPGSPP
jgi:predicted Zn finger-like uncharacterized protein